MRLWWRLCFLRGERRAVGAAAGWSSQGSRTNVLIGLHTETLGGLAPHCSQTSHEQSIGNGENVFGVGNGRHTASGAHVVSGGGVGVRVSMLLLCIIVYSDWRR